MLQECKTVEYPISANYCAKWSIAEAIREIISNAMDTGYNYNIYWNNGYGYVEDSGPGFPKECLILGEGEEKTNDQIGQFKEGLKIAGLVFARNNRAFIGSTEGFSFSFKMGDSDVFDCRVLCIEIFENTESTTGTSIKFECSEAELDIARSLFLDDPRPGDFIIIDRPGEIFINKMFVTSIDNCLFGYNITNKNAANRDRAIVDTNYLRFSIATIWSRTDDHHVIKKYLESKKCKLEHTISFSIDNSTAITWNEVINEYYGKRCCLYDIATSARQVEEFGYTVIVPVTFNVKFILNYYLNIPYASDVLKNRVIESYTDITSQLTPMQLRVYNTAISIIEQYFEEPINIEVVERISFLEDGDCIAHYDSKHKIIRVTPKVIDKGLKYLVGIIAHEMVHSLTGDDDLTRAFEDSLTATIGDLLVKLNKNYLTR